MWTKTAIRFIQSFKLLQHRILQQKRQNILTQFFLMNSRRWRRRKKKI